MCVKGNFILKEDKVSLLGKYFLISFKYFKTDSLEKCLISFKYIQTDSLEKCLISFKYI